MDSTPQQPPQQPEDDWLLSPTPPSPQLTPTEVIVDGTPVQATDVVPTSSRGRFVGAAGLVAAGLVAGAVGTLALGHRDSSTTVLRPAGSTQQAAPGFVPGQQDDSGGSRGSFGAGPGGVAGEQHVQGTVAGVSGSTLKVATGAGTASYTVTSSTQVVRNGQVATLAQLKTGDRVVVHVITSGGSTVIERVIAGTVTDGFRGGPPPGFGPDGAGAPDGGTVDG